MKKKKTTIIEITIFPIFVLDIFIFFFINTNIYLFLLSGNAIFCFLSPTGSLEKPTFNVCVENKYSSSVHVRLVYEIYFYSNY